jgi:acyl carrier protein
MQDAIAQAQEKFGQINGVLHAAGIADDAGVIQRRSREMTEGMMAPKVRGTLVLDRLLKGVELDFFILFSSLGSILYRSKFGEVSYCASTNFLDAFAYYKTYADGIFTVSINWDDWQKVGMSVEAVKRLARNQDLPDAEALLKDGLLPAEGVDTFRRILNSSFPQIAVSTKDLISRFERDEISQALASLATREKTNLSQPTHPRPGLSHAYITPRNEIEQAIADIWQEILGIEKVGIHDDFFELGGHSLMATQLMSRVRTSFGVELPLQNLFASPTIESLSKSVQAALLSQPSAAKSDLKALREEAVRTQEPNVISRQLQQNAAPLSFGQQRLWLLDQLQQDSCAYNEAAAMRLVGCLNVAALEQALNEIVRRHEALRTTFSVVDGQPVQVITPSLTMDLPVMNLGELPESVRSQKVQQLIAEWSQQRFDLAQSPLLRWMLLQLDEQEYLLLLSTHHIVTDGWSVGVFFQELATLYNAFSQGQPSPLPELPIQYADFAIWQRQWLQGDVLETQLAYWKQQLGTNPSVLELPTERSRSSAQTSSGRKQFFALSPRLTAALKTLSQQEGVTLFMSLLAAFKVLLYRYSGQADIIVGSPIANRNRSETDALIGFFVNTLVLRTDLSGNPTFREVLKRVRQVALGAYAHQDLPFEKLVAELQPERHLGHTPLFRAWFVLQNTPMPAVEIPGLALSLSPVDTGVVRHDLKLDLTETPEGLQGFFEYKTDLFEASAIAGMAQLYETLLSTVVEQADIQLDALVTVLANAEKQQQILKEKEFQTTRRQKLSNIRRKAVSD